MHAALVAEHGGVTAPAKAESLESALDRPRNLVAYAQISPAIERLAAAYGFGLARDHCFADGNKRIALAAVDAFLQLNGRELTASEPDAVVTIVALAAGQLSEESFAAWIVTNSRRANRKL